MAHARVEALGECLYRNSTRTRIRYCHKENSSSSYTTLYRVSSMYASTRTLSYSYSIRVLYTVPQVLLLLPVTGTGRERQRGVVCLGAEHLAAAWA